MWNLLKKGKSVKKELFSFKDEPLTNFSIFLLIILDIFILMNISIGIESETNKAPKLRYHYPHECSKHFKEVQTQYKDFKTNYYKKYPKSDLCEQLKDKIDIFKNTQTFSKNSKQIKNLNNKIRKNTNRLNQISKQYNTRLFEQIARMPNNKALNEAKQEYEALSEDNKRLKYHLESIIKVTKLKGYDEYKKYVETNKEIFEKQKQDYKFWQPFKEYAYMLLFITPLLLLFGFFYLRTKKKQLKGEKYNPIVKIISAHISFILLLPVVWYSITLIYHVIPKTLLKNIVEFLVDIGLVSLLNYFSIVLVVAFFGGLIYFIQKKTSQLKQERLLKKDYKKLISFSQCFNCERKIDYSKEYCPFCGIKLKENCIKCGSPNIKNEPFCSSCGSKKED